MSEQEREQLSEQPDVEGHSMAERASESEATDEDTPDVEGHMMSEQASEYLSE